MTMKREVIEQDKVDSELGVKIFTKYILPILIREKREVEYSNFKEPDL